MNSLSSQTQSRWPSLDPLLQAGYERVASPGVEFGARMRLTGMTSLSAGIDEERAPGAWRQHHASDVLDRNVFINFMWSWDEEEHRVRQVTEAVALDGIIFALAQGSSELASAASRLSDLKRLTEEDESEPSINVDSARETAIFLIRSQRHLGRPRIAVNPKGLLLVEYEIAENGVLAVEFFPSAWVRYAAVSAPATAETERARIRGTVPRDLALEMIQPFMAKFR